MPNPVLAGCYALPRLRPEKSLFGPKESTCQDDCEEIDFQPAASSGGENWGWDCREGAHPCPHPNCSPACTGPGPLIDPILEYAHTPGNCSVIGGFYGTYIYGDFCTGFIWFATEEPPGT